MNTQQKLPALLQNPTFRLGAQHANQFPRDDAIEIAFAGRSNVGKSSAINTICQRKKLARTSKTPGRTQQINFFDLTTSARLVDLPGYGFAQVPLKVKQQWMNTIQDYLTNRENLIALVLLMDIRHPFTELDMQMVDWASEVELRTHVLLTKADKLKRSKMQATVLGARKTLENYPGSFTVSAFSSLNHTGVEEVREHIDDWAQAPSL